MNRLRTRAWIGVMVILAVTSLAGCDLIQGIHTPKNVGPHTVEYRVDAEVLLNATLVREDTPAEHKLGRHAYITSTDRLLVLTRITSWLEKPPGRENDGDAPMVRVDRIMERSWFTLPPDLPMGKELRIDEMQKRFLLGYDEGHVEVGYFIQPFQMEGKMTLLEMRPDALVVDMDVNIRPRPRNAWRVNGLIEAKVTPTGIHATKAKSELVRRMARESGVVVPLAGGAFNSVNLPPTATQPSPTTRPAAKDPTAPAASANPDAFMGRWTGDVNGYHYHFQFENAARFLFTSHKPGDAATMAYREGTYEYKGNYLILHVLRYELAGVDKIADMATTHLVMKVDWEANAPTIDGDLKTHEGRIRLPLKQGSFDDMRIKRPSV